MEMASVSFWPPHRDIQVLISGPIFNQLYPQLIVCAGCSTDHIAKGSRLLLATPY